MLYFYKLSADQAVMKNKPSDLHETFESLLQTIEEAGGLYIDLLKVFEDERSVLTAVALPEFMVVNEKKEAILERLKQTEALRLQFTRQLSDDYGLPAGEVTLSRLAACLEGKDGTRLLSSGEKLAGTLARIRQANRVNRRLVSDSLGFVRDSLQMLQSLRRPSATYHNDGLMTHGTCRGTILAGEI